MPTALVVDDSDVNYNILARMLVSLGYTVTTVNRGRAAVSAVRNTSFDLIITDFCMPGMNGEQTATVIKILQPDANIILWSATPPPILDPNLFCGQLVKPVNRIALIQLLTTLNLPIAIDSKATHLPLLPRASSSSKADAPEKENVILPPPVPSRTRRLSPASSTASNSSASSAAASTAVTPGSLPSPNSAAAPVQL